MTGTQEITRFSDDVICSQTQNANNFLGKVLKDGTTLGQISQDYGKITFVNMDIETSDTPQKDSKWAFVDLKKRTKYEPLYYFATYDNDSGMFDGFMIGSPSRISGPMQNYVTHKDQNLRTKYYALVQKLTAESEPETPKHKPKAVPQSPAKEALGSRDAMTAEIYGNLLINNWCSESGLARFLLIAGHRLEELREQGRTEYYEENASNRNAIINTGLINAYKEDIYVLYRYNLTKGSYWPHCIIKSKADWLDCGFTKDKIRTIKPIRFYDLSDALGAIDMDDIDIPTDTYTHIIKDNKERLESVIGEGYTPEMIADSIRNAVTTCIKMLERDPGYAKPYYTSKAGLSWMLPLHINSSLSEEPEFGLILSKNGEYYTIKTAVPYGDEVKDCLTVSSLYGKNW